jgi:ABC-type Fe3+/spermidine/putrescine transport system ATPase subunit
MYLQVKQLTKAYHSRPVVRGVSLEMDQGEILSLLGPSGCGKTTILRMLAGLVTPDSGSIQVGDRVFYSQGREVAVDERQIGMVFQDLALWPHMTVADNISFGLRLQRKPAGEIARRVTELLELVNLPGMGPRYPHQMSGGQQQRVAVARALSTEPRLVLLDEPLSSLDTGLRESMRTELVQLFRRLNITAINVTHDQDEAMTMSDRIMVLRDGEVQQTGTPTDLYLHPANTFVAAFMGPANLLPGDIIRGAGDGISLRLDQGAPERRVVTGQLNPNASARLNGHANLVFRPEDIRVFPEVHPVTHSNLFEGTVSHTSFVGGQWRTWVRIELTDAAPVLAFPAFQPQVGQHLWLELPPERCQIVPA